jgi:hypothetical protein
MNKMKKFLIGMIGLAAMTGEAFAANIAYVTDSNFSDQTTAAGDSIYIRSGANVTLDQDTPIPSLSTPNPSLSTVFLSHNTGNGTLTIASAYSMTATTIYAGHLTQGSGKLGTVNQSAGSVSVTTLNVGAGTGSGEYNMSGGSLTTGGTLLNIGSKGEFNISGGTMTNTTRMGVRGTFTITGNEATINVHQMRDSENSGLFEFVFDSDGVSTIASDSWVDFSSASILIDGANYEGGAGDFLLVSAAADLLDGGFDTSKMTVGGFGEEGVGWNLTQDLDANTVTFTVVPEPGTYALLGGLLALGHVMLRRRR